MGDEGEKGIERRAKTVKGRDCEMGRERREEDERERESVRELSMSQHGHQPSQSLCLTLNNLRCNHRDSLCVYEVVCVGVIMFVIVCVCLR